MFNAILWSQWKAARATVLLTTLLAFGIPLASLQSAAGTIDAQGFVAAMQRFGATYAVVAALAGLLLALSAWAPDHAGRHVYALSLPIVRSRYALFRFSAGLTFLMPTVIGLLIGASAVALSGSIPDGLHVYPVALTLRFMLAAIVSYSVFFAIASSTSRTAGYIIAAIVGLIFAQFLLMLISSDTNSATNIIEPVLNFIFRRPGILSVFTGRWMLIDV